MPHDGPNNTEQEERFAMAEHKAIKALTWAALCPDCGETFPAVPMKCPHCGRQSGFEKIPPAKAAKPEQWSQPGDVHDSQAMQGPPDVS